MADQTAPPRRKRRLIVWIALPVLLCVCAGILVFLKLHARDVRYYNRGELFLENGDSVEALLEFRAAVALNPKFLEARVGVVRALIARKEFCPGALGSGSGRPEWIAGERGGAPEGQGLFRARRPAPGSGGRDAHRHGLRGGHRRRRGPGDRTGDAVRRQSQGPFRRLFTIGRHLRARRAASPCANGKSSSRNTTRRGSFRGTKRLRRKRRKSARCSRKSAQSRTARSPPIPRRFGGIRMPLTREWASRATPSRRICQGPSRPRTSFNRS